MDELSGSIFSKAIKIENGRLFIRFGDGIARYSGKAHLITLFLVLILSLCFLVLSIFLNLFMTGDFFSFMSLSPANIALIISIFAGAFVGYYSLFGVLERDPFKFFVISVVELEELRKKLRYFDLKMILMSIFLPFPLSILLIYLGFDLELNLKVLHFLVVSYLVLLCLLAISAIVWIYLFGIYISFTSKNNLVIVFDKISKVISYRITSYDKMLERHIFFDEKYGYPYLKFLVIVFDGIYPSLRLLIQHFDYKELLYIFRAPLTEIQLFVKKILDFQAFSVKKILFTRPLTVEDVQI